MNLSFGKLNGVCLDCIHQHAYVINGCQHTLCMNCLYEAINNKIELQRTVFLCPRCESLNEHQTRTQSISKRKSNADHEKKELTKQLPKLEQDDLNEQREQTILAPIDNHDDSSWPMGTESWVIHEIKPQRDIFARKECAKQPIKFQTTANSNEGCSQQSVAGDLLWPVGTESWHIHEIKPQRRRFTIIISERTGKSNEPEKSLESSTYFIQAEPILQTYFMKDLQGKPTEQQEIDFISFEKIPSESNEANSESRIPMLPVYSNLLITRKIPKKHSFIGLSSLISHAITVLLICLSLIRGNTGNLRDATPAENNLRIDCQKPKLKPNGCRTAWISKIQYTTKLLPDKKTIQRLRNLESLWIYAIT